MGSISGWITQLQWSSFVPDTIVALLTGVAVAAGVFWAERKTAKRDEKKAAVDAQWSLLRTVRMWTTGPIHFRPDVLRPADEKLEKVLAEVRALPMGRERELAPGVHLLRRLVISREALERGVLDLEQAIEQHSEVPDEKFAAYVRRAAHGFAQNEDTSMKEWLDQEDDDARYAAEASDDRQLNSAMWSYQLSRRTLNAIFMAFIEFDGAWRQEEWSITLERSRNNARTRIGRWRNRRIDERKLRNYRDRLEADAYCNLSKVNPYF